MSADTISIKPNNHRIHPCPNDKKLELLNKIISENDSLDIIVVTSVDDQSVKDSVAKEIKVMNDKEFILNKELRCEMLISYDVPSKALIYPARVAKATQSAIMLVNESEQKVLHKIEMLLGRAIKQEVVEGFEYFVEVKEEPEYTGRKMTKVQIKDEAKKRYDQKVGDEKPKREYNSDDGVPSGYKKDFKSDKKPYDKKPYDKKPYDKSKGDDRAKKDDKWAKKDKAPNKFLGKDENGKAIFSGKSGDRNHRHDGTQRDKWDAPKKVGRKINIKALNKKKDEE